MNNKNIIENYKDNNKLDLEKVIEDYSGYVYKLLQNMSYKKFSKEDTEEIVSDTFLILWKNREKLDNDKKMSSYIAGIVKNLIKEKSRVININFDISDYENTIEDVKKLDMIYEEREKTYIIEKSVKKMKEEDILIFKLYYYSSRKIKEIADILNISEFKVKTRLFRIRKKIKKDLEKGGYSNE